MFPPSVLDLRKHCFCSCRLDAHGGRLTWHAIFGSLFTKIHSFKTILFTQKYNPALKMCCYTNVVSWIGVESKAINEMVIIAIELMPLDRVADSVNLKFFYFLFSCIFILLSRESDQCAIRARLGVAGHLFTTPRWGSPAKCLSQRHNK